MVHNLDTTLLDGQRVGQNGFFQRMLILGRVPIIVVVFLGMTCWLQNKILLWELSLIHRGWLPAAEIKMFDAATWNRDDGFRGGHLTCLCQTDSLS